MYSEFSVLRKTVLFWFLVCLGVVQNGCVQSRYTLHQDGAPEGEFDASNVPDAVPRFEVRTIAGNKSPYTVNGKSYWIMDESVAYLERGIGSWYGRKFHGYRTSNGEVYNMYGMTAAHKTLPIPSYVRVTNLANGKVVVVRVNDRGPFHEGRIIDLSFAAAKKLGYSDKGVAQLEVELLPMPSIDKIIKPEALVDGSEFAPGSGQFFLQVGAYKSQSAALSVKREIRQMLDAPVFILKSGSSSNMIYRVRAGPYQRKSTAEFARQKLLKHHDSVPFVVAGES
ncbi:MAG: septal ring lytic transglycosylase RlpA family lipoprotein [Gammaproteobacteria bacterium]|nr:MAG: septal ring lytic transglycosylase RlpA family lipoprotein [Gammaproteobacteria bacterium]